MSAPALWEIAQPFEPRNRAENKPVNTPHTL
ncbi:hypothetical protein J3B00_003859 [Pseudomonas sp. BP8]|nr:hypothetical protein [Pseudomonas sp. BP8]